MYFKPQIESRNLTLFTDHKTLTASYSKKTSLKSARQQRHLSVITEYVSEVFFISGFSKIVSDYLSRPCSIDAVAADLFDLSASNDQQSQDSENNS